MQDDDIVTLDSRNNRNHILDQHASSLSKESGKQRDPPSVENDFQSNPVINDLSALEADIVSSLTFDQSFLPPDYSVQLEFSNEDFIPFPDPSMNSVLGIPVVPAEDIEQTTSHMMDIRTPSPRKADIQVTASNNSTSKDIPLQEEAIKNTTRTKQRKPCSKTTAARRWSAVMKEGDFIRLVKEFRRQGFPLGLATEVCTDKMEAPYRIWLVDNNSSLEKFKDQHVVRFRVADQSVRLIPCTRWAELVATLESHALLADMMKINAQFWFIRGERLELNLSKTDVRTVCSMLRQKPTSDARLPWKMIFDTTYKQIKHNAQGYQAVVVVAGARLPSSESHAEEFYQAIQILKNTRASIVIRLASKDALAAKYYESLGADGTLDIHVIGDFLDHANRVFRANPWLNYTLPLHRCREMGYNPRVFGKLEQRALDKDELREFMVILFGKKVMFKAPDMHWDWPDFFRFLSEKNDDEGMHWRMATGRLEQWIDMNVLNQLYGTKALRKDIPRNSKGALIDV